MQTPVRLEEMIAEEELVPLEDLQTSKPDGKISDEQAPLADLREANGWSLVSMILAILALMVSVASCVAWFVKARNKEDSGSVLQILDILAGFIMGILFIILEDMNMPMVTINRWTILILLGFVMQIVFLMANLMKDKKRQKRYV